MPFQGNPGWGNRTPNQRATAAVGAPRHGLQLLLDQGQGQVHEHAHVQIQGLQADNCQIGVFANDGSAQGHTFLDRRLFLPQEWAPDPARRKAAGVPAAVVFRTKPELALEMLTGAVTEGVRFRWVGGDRVSGDSPTFVQGVRQVGQWYVVDTSADARAWTAAGRAAAGEVGGGAGNAVDDRGGPSISQGRMWAG